MIGFYAAGAMGTGGGGGGDTWVETYQAELTNNGGNWAGGLTSRILIPSSALMAASKVRLTLRGGSASFNVAQAAIGLRATTGDAYDFAATPVTVTAGGSGSFTIPAGDDIVTDQVSLTIPSGRDIVFAFYAAAGGGRFATATAGWASYYKAANDVTTVNATGYTTESRRYFIRRIECVA